MLKELRIRNFALIDNLSVSFDPNLNILTGETGAGKTILINALNLVLGGRAFSEYIRSGEDSAEVEAAFHLEEGHPIYPQLESSGYTLTPDEDLVIRRIIFRSEKANRCYLNGHIVPLGILVNIGAWLVDIHGQHEHQLLLNPSRHLEILDSFGGIEEDVKQVVQAYHIYQDARKKLDDLVNKKEENRKEAELLAFQREELGRVHLFPGEEDELVRQRKVLAHSAKIQELAKWIVGNLYQAECSVSEILGDAVAKFHEISCLDASLKPMEETLNTILIQIEDLAQQLMGYEAKQDFSAEHLEQIEERLDLINRLKKKYQMTFEDLLAFREVIEERLHLIEDYEGEIQTSFKDLSEKWSVLKNLASELSKKRRYVAKGIEKEVEAHLKDLHINQARFLVVFSDPPLIEDGPPKNMTPRGWDDIEFLFSANVGENPRPLARIASGGEISRVMLAFKSTLAMADNVLSLVFDEIDTGIGGKAASKIGRKIKQLAAKRQVICITHMPQIASHATSHFLVSKRIEKERTLTVVERLSRPEQIQELAKMIAGDNQSEIALKHATEILERTGNPL